MAQLIESFIANDKPHEFSAPAKKEQKKEDYKHAAYEDDFESGWNEPEKKQDVSKNSVKNPPAAKKDET